MNGLRVIRSKYVPKDAVYVVDIGGRKTLYCGLPPKPRWYKRWWFKLRKKPPYDWLGTLKSADTPRRGEFRVD